MRTRLWMFATALGAVTAALGVASAQPSDPAPPPGDGSGSGSDAPARPKGVKVHVADRTTVFTDRYTGSPEAFIANAGEDLWASAQEGLWTLVENDSGVKGWILTAKLVSAALGGEPSNPYDEPPRPTEPPKPPRKPDPLIDSPQVLTTPTGWLLPAAVLYSRNGLDTGGGFTSDSRVGLGDVAEFGVATSDNVRIRDNEGSPSKRIQPYFTASFRLGVAEDRLFKSQPGLVLGFRKSFERNKDNYSSRIAELTLVASKKLGKSAAIHVGAAFWDAQLKGDHLTGGDAFDETLHGYNNVRNQIRPFAGLQARPLERSEILVDLGWSPEFCKDCAPGKAIRLRPELSWGVRYRVASFMNLESGVRVPDIGNANLLDAQIFGQVTFIGWGLRHAVDSLK